MKDMKNIEVPKMDISFAPAKKKGSQIEKAISAVGSVNTKAGKSPVKMEGLLKRHGKEKFQIDLN